MTVTVADIDRILLEIEPIEPQDWLDREDISMEAIAWLVRGAQTNVQSRYRQGDIESFIFFDTVAVAFMVGWECGREYGRRKR